MYSLTCDIQIEFSQVELYAVWAGATQFPLSGFVHVEIIQLLAA